MGWRFSATPATDESRAPLWKTGSKERTGQLDYLNVGCGDTYHPEWTNVDMATCRPGVQVCNLLKGFPYPDRRFQVVYHSHVLEHIPREQVSNFIRECYRVLKPGGILRVVVPDLENIVREYLQLLQENLAQPSPPASARYDWIMVELYEQAVRHIPGGQMGDFAQRLRAVDPDYLAARIGRWDSPSGGVQPLSGPGRSALGELGRLARKTVRFMGRAARRLFYSKAHRIGLFRLSGEIHLWMYDRFSLARLLKENGFENIQVQGPFTSAIPDWGRYELDIKDGKARFPTSLFMEASRPQ